MKNNIKTQRQLRVGQQLKHLISEIILIGDFENEKLKKTQITVTEVNNTPKLKKADVVVISRDNKKTFIKYLNEKKFKEEASEVKEGSECGMVLENFQDIKQNDILESYIIEEQKRSL